MVRSSTPILSQQIARHYDELDPLYRLVWGLHLHHGWFQSGSESIEEATTKLSHEVARRAGIRSGDFVCDIGCGYGATSRFLASEFGANVTGITLSSEQLKFACSWSNPPQLEFRLMDWLNNNFQDASFDHLISIESSEHMHDKQKFFSEASRVLKPNGSFTICAWLSSNDPSPTDVKYLLEPICREGRLPSMGSEKEYRKSLEQTGFLLENFTDITDFVKRTWSLCLLRLIKYFFVHPTEIRWLFPQFNSNAEFIKTPFRIRIAYEIGAMRYGIFKAHKIPS